jgi:hypothetical protein
MVAFFGGIRGEIGAEKAEIKDIQGAIKMLRDAIRRAELIASAISKEERAEARGLGRAEARAEVFEEEELITLFRDLIGGFRYLVAYLYGQLREERMAGRKMTYERFKGAIESEINTLIRELQALGREEARE